MNISLNWFMEYGLLAHDNRTIENVLDKSFITHAKSVAIPSEIDHIDRCIKKLQLTHSNNRSI